jgi:predicted translin family RNA/ssDNA-binding protein
MFVLCLFLKRGCFEFFFNAAAVEHYLRTGKLVTRELAMRGIWDIPLTIDDYALGLFDLSGEIMRFAVTAIATTGSLPHLKSSNSSVSRSILTDLRHLRTSFEALDTTSCLGTTLGRDIDKKMETMVQSVEKVENAACSLIIRDHEQPKRMPEPSDNN